MKDIVETIEAIGIILATLFFIIPPIRKQFKQWKYKRIHQPGDVFKAVDFSWVNREEDVASVTIKNDSPCDVIGGGILIEYRTAVSREQNTLVGSVWWIPPYENVKHSSGDTFVVIVELEGYRHAIGPGVYPWVARANSEVRWA